MSNAALTKVLNLTPRDIEIILAVFDYDGLFSYQIRNRFWGKNGHPSTYYERLADLVKSDYLRAKSMNSSTGRGSGYRLITIGRASHSLLRERRGLDERGIRQLRHSIAMSEWLHDAFVRDFRQSLEFAASVHPNVADVEWINEAVFKRAPIKAEVADRQQPERMVTVELVPDGSFWLELTSGVRKQHYLELDQDTEHRTKIVGRIRAYLKHVGNAQIPVLWVVPSHARAEKLESWIQQEASSLKARASVFAITTRDQVSERQVLTHPIWEVVGVSGKRSLLPASGAADAQPWFVKLGQEPASA